MSNICPDMPFNVYLRAAATPVDVHFPARYVAARKRGCRKRCRSGRPRLVGLAMPTAQPLMVSESRPHVAARRAIHCDQ